jgi:hypothetical protein
MSQAFVKFTNLKQTSHVNGYEINPVQKCMHLYIQTNLTPKKLNCMDITQTHNKWRTQGAFEMVKIYVMCNKTFT